MIVCVQSVVGLGLYPDREAVGLFYECHCFGFENVINQ